MRVTVMSVRPVRAALTATFVVATTIAWPGPAHAQGTAPVEAARQRAPEARRDTHGAPNDTLPLARRVTATFRDATLNAALQELGVRAGVRLIYSARVVPLTQRVTLSLDDVTMQQALARVLAGLPVEALADRDRIVLVPRAAPAAATAPETEPPVAAARLSSVRGRVSDSASGAPIPSVTVTITSPAHTATARTNANGIYVLLDVPAGRYALQARQIGYQPVERAIVVADSLGLRLDLTMQLRQTHLQEVVTTATGERRRLEIGNDIVVINADSLVREQPIATVTELLEGRVPGMTIQRTSGTPGDPARIRLRGTTSPLMSNDPIIIVDGIRVYSEQSNERGGNLARSSYAAPSPLDYIDPNSIATIEVVKGPSAATLYGPDAANGVIVITTKQGQDGPTRWTVSAERGITRMADRYPELMVRWGHQIGDDARVFCPINNRVSGLPTRAVCQADSAATFQLLNDRDLTVLDEGNRTAATLGVSGGSGALTYNVTGSFRDEVGLVRLPQYELARYREEQGRAAPDWMERPQSLTQWSVASRLGARLGDAADVSLSSNLSRTRQQRSELEQQLGRLMSTYLDRTTGVYYQAASTNISEIGESLDAYHERATAVATRFANGVNLTWRPLAWLTTSADAGIDVVQRADEVYLPYGFGNTGDQTGRVSLGQGTSVMSSVNLRATTTVPIRDRVRLQVAGGVNYRAESIEDLTGEVRGIGEGRETPNDAQEITNLRQNRVDQATFGWYLEPSLNVRNLWVSTGLRMDGGNTFGSRASLPAFPKVSVSYLLSEEPFFPWRGVLPSLRLRAAYGEAGRQPGPVDRLRLYGASTQEWVDGGWVTGVRLAELGNGELRPERSRELEAGLDAELFGDRLTLGLTGFRKNTTDAILDVPVPPSVYGENVRVLRNIGVVRNTGLEASLNATVLRSDPATWDVQLGVSRQRNVVVELGRGVEPFYASGGPATAAGGTRVVAGYPLFGRWMLPVLGYADANGNGVLDATEVVVGDTAVYVGGTLPNYTANLNTTVRLLRGALAVTAGVMYEDGLSQTNEVGRRLANFSRGWNDPTAPLAEQVGIVDPTSYSWVQTVSTLRFNSLAVTYNLAVPLAARLGARAMSLSLQGTNLGLRTNYSGLDPNVNASYSGNAVTDTGVLPRPRTWQLRVNATY
jgi:TonB-linked SusC/RagA family outer membrane protein